MKDAAPEADRPRKMRPDEEWATITTIPIEELVENGGNPRRSMNGPALEELVASVRAHGVLQPILVRPIAAKPPRAAAFEVVAGHRRLAAARKAGLTALPALVRELSDKEALEVAVIENLQRSDLHPLEEAEGYRQLMHVHKYDVARIAERIGRSTKYVYDRVKLLSLTEKAQKLFLDDRITAGHAIILARLKPEDQERAFELGEGYRSSGPLFEEEQTLFTEEQLDGLEEAKAKDPYLGMKTRSVRELQAWVDKHVRFDPSAQDVPDLFPETHGVVRRAKEATEKIIPITHDYQVQPEARDGNRIWGPRSWQRADGAEDSKTCEHSVTGVIVIGAGRGEAFKVCTAKEKCKVHWGAWQRDRAKVERAVSKEGGTGEDRQRVQDRKWKEQREREEAERKRRVAATPAVLKAAAANILKLPAGATGRLADLIVWQLGRGRPLKNAVPRGRTAEDLVRHLAYDAIAQEARDGWNWERFSKFAGAVGVDIAKIMKEQAPVQTSAKPEASAKKVPPARAKGKALKPAKRDRARGKRK